MASTSSARSSLSTIDQFIASVGAQQKTAGDKAADTANTEAGSIGGETTHPVKSVDDRTQEATEGARSQENTEDVKEDQGKPSVDSTPEAKAASIRVTAARLAKRAEGQQGGSAAEDQLQIGTNKQPTGEDPKNETGSAKGGKEDGGTYTGKSTHPARTDNDELQGGKYAADTPIEKLASDMKAIGDDLLAGLALYLNDAAPQKTAAAQIKTPPVQSPKPQPQPKAASEIDPQLAAQFGYEMAGLLTGNFDKRAADSLVVNTIKDVIKQAQHRAELVVGFMQKYASAQHADQAPTKTAMGGMPGGGMPGGGGGAPPMDESAMLGAMGGGADAGGMPGSGADAGGMPGGGMPGEEEGGGMPGGEGEIDPEQLMAILSQLGLPPEKIQELIAGGGMEEGMGGGGMEEGMEGGAAPPPGGEGGPPPEGKMAQAKTAQAKTAQAKTAQAKTAQAKTAQAKTAKSAKSAGQDKYANVRSYLAELIRRSNAG